MHTGDSTGLSRRDVVKGAAKVGVAGAAVAFVAPKFEGVAFAASKTGSPLPTTTTGGATTSSTAAGGPTGALAQALFHTDQLPEVVQASGFGWAPNSTIVITMVGPQ